MVQPADKQKEPPNSNAFHQEHQIKWKDLDFKKFFALNIAFNFVVDAVVYPLDLIRTRMQVQGSSMIQTSYPKYTNSLDCVRQIVKQEGFRGLFKGFGMSEAGYVSSHVVYYSVYEVFKQKLQDYYPPEQYGDTNVFVTTAVAGGIADLACCAVSVPSEVATTRLQIQGSLRQAKYASGIDVLSQIYYTEGVRGWYRGFGATLLRNVPSSAIWWGTYEVAKNKLHALGFSSREKRLLADKGVEDEDPSIHIIAGAIAGIVTTVGINPIDVAKTRLQSVDVLPTASPTQPTVVISLLRTPIATLKRFGKHNLLSVMVSMVKEEGFRAFGKGLVPALIISAPYSAIQILLYEKVKKLSALKDGV